ncbi:MAG: hypothetical protein AAB875_01175, partial [Patescibacteria group bacterium]
MNSQFENLLNELNLKWDSPYQKKPGVMEIYLNIENPIITSEPFPQDLLNALRERAKYEKVPADTSSLRWTRDYSLKSWIKDVEKEDEFWSTNIPKKALPIIKQFGYDGIKDTGGKGGGPKHIVWIAFDSEQIFLVNIKKFQLDLSEFSPEEQQAINLLQEGKEIPDSLSGAVVSLQTKGVIKPAVKAPVARPIQPLIKLEQGERVSRRGITISRSRQAISRPYRVSYETGDKYVVKTFQTAEDASRRFNSMVELRAKGFARAGELPEELQATKSQKTQAHMIAEKKKITPSQYTRLAKIYTGVDSMIKMTPEKAQEFINVLKTIKPKFGGLISISRSQEIVKAEDAERKFHETTIGWLLDIFRTPANVFRKI